MDINFEELKRRCAAATPGEWHSPGLGEVHAEDHSTIVDVCWRNPDEADEDAIGCGTQADADYIAAVNPATVSDLITRLEKALVDAERLDWLEKFPQSDRYANIDHISAVNNKFNGLSSLRDAIDAARVQGEKG